MFIRVQVDSADVETVKSKEGEIYRKQRAWGFFKDAKGNPDKYPQAFDFFLSDDQKPYPVNDYVMAGDGLYLTRERFPRLAISKIRLLTYSEAAKAAQDFFKSLTPASV
ncbi:MAG: G5P family DNA-binding protein [Burkholderiaceae bacterium]|nr:G5P family DNA-binding protein [Burkholderiaceae bacterium]